MTSITEIQSTSTRLFAGT